MHDVVADGTNSVELLAKGHAVDRNTEFRPLILSFEQTYVFSKSKIGHAVNGALPVTRVADTLEIVSRKPFRQYDVCGFQFRPVAKRARPAAETED
jgi:hypothetical protein